MTGRELDFALTEPKQYFNVLMPGGWRRANCLYATRNFYVSPVENGQVMLVNGDGYPVANSAGLPITFADNVTNYTVNRAGIWK